MTSYHNTLPWIISQYQPNHLRDSSKSFPNQVSGFTSLSGPDNVISDIQKMAGPSTRSAGPMYNPEVHFSPNEKFQPPEKLPTVKSVLCSILYHVR